MKSKPRQPFPEDFFGHDREENHPSIFRHKESGDKYRKLGVCINKDSDDLMVLYRKWNDFGSVGESLYVRSYKSFHETFEAYEYESIALLPTEDQRKKDYERVLGKPLKPSKRKARVSSGK
jgi:hypothetical protein